MKYLRPVLAALALLVTLGSYLALAQQQPAGGRGGAQAPPQPMSFFVTGTSKGDGANYGGLAGADAWCQQLAQAAGRGNAKWVAYLSTQGPGAVNARDRIGQGPWYNSRGGMVAASLAELHGDTLDVARLGNRINKQSARNEKGDVINGVGDMPNQHDILTGSTPDGRAFTDGMDHTCNNYSANTDGRGQVQLGHHDKNGGGNGSWNSAHGSRGCSQPNLVATGGNGYLYCFAPGQ
ncbi:MAG: lectin [Acidobacteria bacterium]|nr:lectin [Acidobacteriota bacterium]